MKHSSMSSFLNAILLLGILFSLQACVTPKTTPLPPAFFTPVPSPFVTLTPFLPDVEFPTPTLTPAFDLSWNLIQNQIDASRKDLNATASIKAPFIDNVNDPAHAEFNIIIHAYVNSEIEEAYKYITAPIEPPWGAFAIDYIVTTENNWSLEKVPIYIKESTGNLSANEAVLSSGHDVLSVVFETFDFFGGVHPAIWHKSINYDLSLGRPLSLEDLFTTNTPFLQTIADYCIRDLSTHPQDLFPDYATDSAAPTTDNYRNWALTPKGLFILFDDYQVSPHAAGPQYVLIPYDALVGIIDPQGPIGQFAK